MQLTGILYSCTSFIFIPGSFEASQAQLDDGLMEFSSISADASVDQLMAGFLKLAHGAHTEDQDWAERERAELWVARIHC